MTDKFPLTHQLLGTTLQKVGRHLEALIAYDLAIKLDPRDAVAYAGSNWGHCELKRYPKSLIVFQHAIRCTPQEFLSYKGLALTFSYLSRYEEALAVVDKALELVPNDAALLSLQTAVEFDRW